MPEGTRAPTNPVGGAGVVFATATDALPAAIEPVAVRHGGRVVAGNRLVAVFPSAAAAVGCALEAVANGAARFAIYGPVEAAALETGVARCLAILGAARAGDVIAPIAVVEAAGVDDARDLGTHRLGDGPRPERLYRLAGADRPLCTIDVVPNNLPVPPTSFIGRLSELAVVCRAIDGASLVTITGAGGGGKTRLALRAATETLGRFPDGAWLAELAPHGPGEAVVRAVGAVFRAPEQHGRPPIETLAGHLAGRTLLLVLDNCEHVREDAAELASRLVAACPSVSVLATSRAPLDVTGEVVVPLGPLALPEADDPEVVRAAEAVRLFEDRARLRRPGFSVTGESAATVSEICRRLDGVPLAIELAAARVMSLSVAQIAGRLGDRLSLLTSATTDADPRHRTMADAVRWSWDLLDEPERLLLRRLAVFAGSFTLEAAEEVCSGDGLAREGVLDLYAGLVEKSLLFVDEHRSGTRCRLLESVREFLFEQGADSVETGVARRLAEWALATCDPAGPEHERLARIDLEHLNLLEALRVSERSGLTETAARLAGRLWRYWQIHGQVSSGRERLERALAAAPDAPPDALVDALNGLAVLAAAQGDFADAEQACARGLELARLTGHGPTLGRLLNAQANLALHAGDLTVARDRLEEALPLFGDDDAGRSLAMLNLGGAALGAGDAARARELWEQALDGLRRSRSDHGAAHALNNLAILAASQGDLDGAARRWDEALSVFRELGDEPGTATILANLGMLAARRKDAPLAVRTLSEALGLQVKTGDRRAIAGSLRYAALAAQELSDHERAAYLLGGSSALGEEIGGLPVTDRAGFDEQVAAVRDAAGRELFDAAWQSGRAVTTRRLVDAVAAWAAELDRASPGPPVRTDGPVRAGELLLEGDYWTVRLPGGEPVRLRDTKGMRYLAEIVRRAGREVHVLDLVAAVEGVAAAPISVDGPARPAGDAGEVLDAEAKAAYRERVVSLRAEVDEAEQWGDAERAARARAEIDAIAEQLAGAVGLGGRDRRAASDAERARVNVTKVVRGAIRRLGRSDAALGRHLEAAVRTGVFCSYMPDREVDWRM